MHTRATRPGIAPLDVERDFERLREPARRRFLARARRASQQRFVDLDEAADEAYQEAWIEIARRPDAAVPETDAAAYVAGVMWHRFHREHLRPARPELVALDGDVAVDGAGPAEAALVAETRRAVRAALEELPARERDAVLLRALGLRHRDVAASLGVSALRARKLSDAGQRDLAERLRAGDAGERCAGMASTLHALAAGWPVGPSRRGRLAGHLATCPTCRATLAALRHEGRIAVLPVALATPGTFERLLGRVDGAAHALARRPDAAEAATGGVAAAGAGVGVGAKLAVGCIAGLCVGGGAAVLATRTGEAPVSERAARSAPAIPATPASAAATLAARGEAHALRDVRVSSARAVATEAERRARRAQRTAVRARVAARVARRAGQRARQAGQQGVQAGRQAQQAGEQARQAGEQAKEAGRRAQRAGDQATQQVQDALGRLGP